MVSTQKDHLPNLLARFEETQLAQNALQAEQQRLQAKQLRLLKELAQELQAAASHKLNDSSSGSRSVSGLLHSVDLRRSG